tara:strand:+ start:613 stop:780 length:168 start_codon:yes stop_codon:yes gene_type:complete
MGEFSNLENLFETPLQEIPIKTVGFPYVYLQMNAPHYFNLFEILIIIGENKVITH